MCSSGKASSNGNARSKGEVPRNGEAPKYGDAPRYGNIRGAGNMKGASDHECTNAGGEVVMHEGVECDQCGVLPIRGPRYHSKVQRSLLGFVGASSGAVAGQTHQHAQSVMLARLLLWEHAPFGHSVGTKNDMAVHNNGCVWHARLQRPVQPREALCKPQLCAALCCLIRYWRTMTCASTAGPSMVLMRAGPSRRCAPRSQATPLPRAARRCAAALCCTRSCAWQPAALSIQKRYLYRSLLASHS